MNPDFREIFYFSENLLTGVLYDGVTYKKNLFYKIAPGDDCAESVCVGSVPSQFQQVINCSKL